ncbi:MULTISPECIES: HPr kinase/phosphatase C-terminal domain-containing protein [unclassified Yoonia]|uniref:HPr kinase/phosphorylase n=1 Tax=unclassified Yoonia TaxID=2629118 RepID=UPI002AFE66AA|nr:MULTISPECIES: HPr kinase/phosphatase C-terminal domain-containing protein [unclassified Yoonia]
MTQPETRHGTCVAWDDRGVLILGAAGRGKSALALYLMALGGTLVADDRVVLQADGGRLVATCPPAIAGLIEARGVGILNAACQARATVALVVDLDRTADQRLPDRASTRICGCDIPLIKRIDGPHFAAIIVQILKAGWSDR